VIYCAEMEKLDLKKRWKPLYTAKKGTDVFVEVPALNYLMVDGEGDPNTAKSYIDAIEALYSLSYTLKFACKKGPRTIDYGVMPLESLWWANDPEVFYQSDKSSWKWTAMIAQPEFLVLSDIEEAREMVRRKKTLPSLNMVRYEVLQEGSCAQTLHIGPYAAEGPTIQRMHDFIQAAGKQLRGKHHEIYLTYPHRTAPENLKTILRQPVE
jgi:hypothetical protein